MEAASLGGGNAGRVLGKRAGLGTMALDLLKVSFIVLLANRSAAMIPQLPSAPWRLSLGHCYPVFAWIQGRLGSGGHVRIPVWPLPLSPDEALSIFSCP